jgi:hypothetical protein
MSRSAGFALIAGLIFAALALTFFSLPPGAETESDPVDRVIMIRCATDASTFPVTAYQGSANTPAKRADNCPEVLAHLLQGGYEIANVGYSQVDTNFVVYTLLR